VLAEKSGPSHGVNASERAQSVQSTQATQKLEQLRQVEQVGRTEKAALNKVNGAVNQNATARGAQPVEAKGEADRANRFMTGIVTQLEKGQAHMDRLITEGMSGKEFSNAELIALQAGMYKYTQELELTSKVVEKATSGLKDTLKTQV
jgi:transcription termination factor NusB